MRFETAIQINAPSAMVWETLVDVERWPELTASTTSAEFVGGDRALALAARVRVKQPRLKASVWEVTDFDPGVAFTWRSSAGGITTIGTHRIIDDPAGGVTLRLGIDQSGVLAPFVGLVGGRLVRCYVDMEARGLKQRSESLLR